MTDSPKRPVLLSVLVIVGFVTVSTTLISSLLHPVHQWAQVARTIGAVAVLASFVGIWGMRRLGVCLYAAAVSMNLAVLATYGAVRWPYFAVPAIIQDWHVTRTAFAPVSRRAVSVSVTLVCVSLEG